MLNKPPLSSLILAGVCSITSSFEKAANNPVAGLDFTSCFFLFLNASSLSGAASGERGIALS